MRTIQSLVRPTVAKFREAAFEASRPALIRDHFSDNQSELPALRKWFEFDQSCQVTRLNSKYLNPLGTGLVPVEVTHGVKHSASFRVEHMPLASFVDASNVQVASSEYRNGQRASSTTGQMYLAQCPVDSLALALQEDVRAPDLVQHAGAGDVYVSTVWIGLAPTYTPLHKDPNPNLFVQLAGSKTVRLLEPSLGLAYYQEALRRLGRGGNPAIRGAEMMSGEERELLDELVWHSDKFHAADAMYEETVSTGDALFIPMGWWHSIKGIGRGMTGSVNWWFR